jgi:hypothetical protein
MRRRHSSLKQLRLQPTEKSLFLLLSSLHRCECDRCFDPTEFGSYLSAIRCSRCSGFRLLPLQTFTILNRSHMSKPTRFLNRHFLKLLKIIWCFFYLTLHLFLLIHPILFTPWMNKYYRTTHKGVGVVHINSLCPNSNRKYGR